MNHHFQIDRDKNIITEMFKGEITLADLTIANQNILNHPDFIRRLNFLTDLRSSHLQLNYNDMFSHVSSHADLDANKVALVADKSNEYGLARMFEMISKHKSYWKQLRVFREIEEARKWLTQ